MLERLSGPLCDAVLDRTESADVLAGLDRANLFVTPLDSRRAWYRCHRLFRDALHQELSDDIASVVRARAADWFAAQGFLDDAIELRIDAGDPVEARRMLRTGPWFLQRGAGRIVRLGQRLGLTAVAPDPGLCVSLGFAAILAGNLDQMQTWLEAAEAATGDAEPPPGWHTLGGAVATLRSLHLLTTTQLEVADPDTEADSVGALLALAARAVAAETDPAIPGYVLSRHAFGVAYLASGRPLDALPALTEAWQQARQPGFAPILSLQTACSLALALFQVGRHLEARRVWNQSEAAMGAVEQAWGDAAAPGIARLVMVQARLALLDGETVEARRLARRAVTLSKIWGLPSQIVMALTTLAETQLAAGELAEARSSAVEARDLVTAEPIWPFVVEDLDHIEIRVGRDAVRGAGRPGLLRDDLTNRELSILRLLPGTAGQREIGAALFLSINTVKTYTKSLYRKLEVSTRHEAVERARTLNLII